jgi:hypothetical protein
MYSVMTAQIQETEQRTCGCESIQHTPLFQKRGAKNRILSQSHLERKKEMKQPFFQNPL